MGALEKVYDDARAKLLICEDTPSDKRRLIEETKKLPFEKFLNLPENKAENVVVLFSLRDQSELWGFYQKVQQQRQTAEITAEIEKLRKRIQDLETVANLILLRNFQWFDR
jgi:hypothetical protein